jgi:hypothetical protein
VYLRHSTVRKNGKTHTYWRLVRSVRRGTKVRQETVAQLGELDAQGRADAEALARRITGRAEQHDLFEDWSPTPRKVEVRLDRVRLERGRRFGDVWLAWTLWRALQFEKVCAEQMGEGRETVAWSTMAAVLTIARLCEPSSELHIAEDWYRRTALEDLLGVPAAQINDDRLYRALDQLLPHKTAIEQHLRQRLGELFALDYDLLLYDVTSTYFEGQALRNPQAKRGHSRDHRPDCKQVCIALVVTREGIPLGYEVFDGNRTDVTTVEEIVDTMEARFGVAGRVWVMDRGMTSNANIAWLQQTGRRYLVGTPKSDLKRFATQIAEARDWQTVREGVEAKLCAGPDGTETFVLVRSAERCEKEMAMHQRFIERIELGLQKLRARIGRSRVPLDRGRIERQIGRLLGRNSRGAGRYVVRVLDDAAATAKLRLEWSTPLNGTIGRVTARDATSCAATSTTGRPKLFGKPTFNSPKPKLRFASRRATCRSDLSGTRSKSESRHTSSCASSPTRCGRPWSNGRDAPASPTALERFSMSSGRSRALTSSCLSPTIRNTTCASAASSSPTVPKPPCSIASVCDYPSGCACHPPKCSANRRT